MEVLSKSVGWAHHLYGPPLSCSSSPVSPRKENMYLSEALNFANAIYGTPPGHLVWWPAGFILVAPQYYMYLHTQKLLPEGLASNQSESRC